MNIKISQVSGKVLFAALATAGFLAAAPVFAAALAPVPSPTGAAAMPNTTITQSFPPMGITSARAIPCPMMNQAYGSTNMMYSQYPCGTAISRQFMGYSGFGPDMAAWLGLMFVMTVILVWVVLLLLIGVLWKQLYKHKHN